MEVRFLPVGGAAASPMDLTYPKARDLAVRLAADEIAHAMLVECRRLEASETVVFEVRVEVPNRRVHEIRRRERIAATFYDGDERLPKVEALREDFPIVPHLNLHLQEYPRWLCLYEERHEELKRRWTAPRFVHRIRGWLELTARGELHQEDQRLEPLLVDYSGHIVLPPDLATNVPEQLFLTGISFDEKRPGFLIAHRQPPAEPRRVLPIVVKTHGCLPRTHGVIRRCPATLAELSDITESAGLNLIGELRSALPTWKEKSLDSHVVLLLVFPRTRIDGGPVEGYDPWCFAIAQSVKQLGVELGVWVPMNGELATLLPTPEEKRGADVSVLVLNPCFALTRDGAARLNGRAEATDTRIVGVGVGALGSQIVMNFAREGFGRWTLIDPDRLMPHNTARHALDGSFVGWNKAETVAYSASTLTFETGVFEGLDADLLRAGPASEHATAALGSADVIVDVTASVAAQRHLARDADSRARRICVFLTPSGSDLVVLAEDTERQTKLDALEMQYYRALLHRDELVGHLGARGTGERYARSCGDTTSAIPQDLVALHAAIAARNIKEILSNNASFIGVWRADLRCSVGRVDIETRTVSEFSVGDWTVVLDDGLRERVGQNRKAKLPDETGGVLLGSFDLERGVLYIVDTLPSPPDSEERRDLYVRGFGGLRDSVADVDTTTGGMLEYIGEWHSHPHGASTRPSDYDLAAFGWLAELMSKDGLPAVMIIAGDAGEMSLFVGSMGQDPSPIPEGLRGEVVA